MFEFGWFLLALLAALSNGIQGFLTKAASENNSDPVVVSFAGATVSYILAGIFLLNSSARFGDHLLLLLLSTIGAVGFILIMICRLAALKVLPASIVLPLFRSNMLFVLAFSLLLPEAITGDRDLSIQGIAGVLCLFGTVFVIALERKENRAAWATRGIFLTITAALVSALLYLSQQIAVTGGGISPNALIFVVNLEVAIICLVIILARKREHVIVGRRSLRNGALIGAFGYVAFLSFLEAIRIGSLALSVAVNSVSLVISVMLAVIFYRERVTWVRITAVLLSVAGLVLIKTGA